MRELCLACAGFVLEFVVFYAAGIVLTRILKIKGDCSLTFIMDIWFTLQCLNW